MNKIYVFYHIYCISDCYERFANTYNKIVSSGLISKISKIYVVLVGDKKEQLKEQLKSFEKVETHLRDNCKSEGETINFLYDFCLNTDCKVLYLHSKGVTYDNNIPIRDWINLMEYFLIEKYESCIKTLDEYDVCGVNYVCEETKPAHFSGNFWWATSRHIKNLKRLDLNPPPDLGVFCRFMCEFWLFDTQSPVKYKVLFNSHFCHYGYPYPRENYADK